MTKKAKMITAVVAAVVVVAGGLGFYLKGGDLMGRMKLPAKEIDALETDVSETSVVSCGETWTKVFEGKIVSEEVVYDDGVAQYPLSIAQSITYSKLSNLMRQGCSFKVVRTAGSGDFSGQTSMECSIAGLYSGDGMFACRTSMISSDGTVDAAYYDGALISFDGYPNVNYVPLANQPSPGYLAVSIFVKK